MPGPARYFVGIGGQKCGTTWLSRVLFTHPDVLHNPIKEMHVFDRLFVPELTPPIDRQARDEVTDLDRRLAELPEAPAGDHDEARMERFRLAVGAEMLRDRRDAYRDLLAMVTTTDADEVVERYQRYFAARVEPRHLRFGEVTPSYSLLPPEGFSTILLAYPDARFVLILRDPVDRFWSGVRHVLWFDKGFDPEARFDELLHRASFSARSRYEATLAALDASVPPEQLLVLFYEELFDPDDDAAARRLERFLGLDGLAEQRTKVVREGKGGLLPEEHRVRALESFVATYDAVAARLGHLPSRWLEQLATAR